MTHSLDLLSDRERDLLILLAQGHTAKTIARSRDLSVNVVNEHLRSARRKTDAPSSRELARLVAGEREAAPQETWDKLIGLEDQVPPGPSDAPVERRERRGKGSIVWRLMMTLSILIAAGLLAWQSTVPGNAEHASPNDGAVAAVASTQPDLIYQVIFIEGENYLGSPVVAGRFGQEVRAEIPDRMRVTMFTAAPGPDGKAYTWVKMQLRQDGVWGPVEEMSMLATLSETPSFQNTVEGTDYRFVVMPRLIVPAAS